MHRKARYLLLVPICVSLCQGALSSPAAPQEAATGKIVEEIVHSVALEANLLGDSPDRRVTIYLPAGYENSRSRYPVVYLLHGYPDTDQAWTKGVDYKPAIPVIMDRAIAAGKIRPMIVVMPNSWNKFGGAFYTNSVTTGNWEDFVTQELVTYIDSKYRTVAKPTGRGIMGHSMGGYGALKLAMEHPDIYGAVYALSACCMEQGENLLNADATWDKTLGFKNMEEVAATLEFINNCDWHKPECPATYDSLYNLAVSAAWSPNPQHPPFFANFPVERREGKLVIIGSVRARWRANDPIVMVPRYRSNLSKLSAIVLDIGKQDTENLTGVRDLDRALTGNGIRHEYEEYEGKHGNKVSERIETKALPFFSRVLE